MSKDAAAYVVRHIHNACHSIVEATRQGAPLEPIAPSLTPILGDLHTRILAPIFRLYPELKTEAGNQPPPKKVYRASRRDISRSTATWLMHELVKAQLAIAKVSVDFTIDQGLGSKAEDVYVSVVTKVLGPAKLISDAYPDIWDKQLNAMRPRQVRTAETDTSFRKTVVPRGSVKLTAPAVAQIRSFMHEARKLTPKDDLVAALGWTTRQRSKGSEDKTWTSIPDGLLLGAFPRSQLPPDVIDKVDGIEIVLTADSPDRLAGKTIDFQKGQFVIRD